MQINAVALNSYCVVSIAYCVLWIRNPYKICVNPVNLVQKGQLELT